MMKIDISFPVTYGLNIFLLHISFYYLFVFIVMIIYQTFIFFKRLDTLDNLYNLEMDLKFVSKFWYTPVVFFLFVMLRAGKIKKYL